MITIDMVKFNWDPTINGHFCPTAKLAPRKFETLLKESFL
jgi:hypothetical protein